MLLTLLATVSGKANVVGNTVLAAVGNWRLPTVLGGSTGVGDNELESVSSIVLLTARGR